MKEYKDDCNVFLLAKYDFRCEWNEKRAEHQASAIHRQQCRKIYTNMCKLILCIEQCATKNKIAMVFYFVFSFRLVGALPADFEILNKRKNTIEECCHCTHECYHMVHVLTKSVVFFSFRI